jgi:hypothetical protein
MLIHAASAPTPGSTAGMLAIFKSMSSPSELATVRS